MLFVADVRLQSPAIKVHHLKPCNITSWIIFCTIKQSILVLDMEQYKALTFGVSIFIDRIFLYSIMYLEEKICKIFKSKKVYI